MLRLMVLVAVLGAGGGASRPQPAAPSDDFENHVSLGLELGPGGVITDYQQSTGPSAVLFYTALRGNYDLAPQWSAELTLREWFLPSSNHATMLGVGARWEPKVLPYGRVFVDGVLGAASTAHAWSFAFDVGGGFEWDMPDLPGFGLGPYLRYGLVASPDPSASGPGQAWTLGGSFTYHFGRAAEGAARNSSEPSHHATTRPFRLSIPDTDHDGVADDEDQCKDIPQGKHPDPFRPGCPEADEDNDGIPDVDDQCPGDPPGDHPDPKRPGCPFVDSDLDGIADEDDACPLKPGPASEDRAKNGCPTGKKARVEEPEEENTPRPNTDESPKPVHKRGM
jgi:hypothetical protein